MAHRRNQRFLPKTSPRPNFWKKKIPQPATENFHHLQVLFKLSFFLLSTKILHKPTTRLKSAATGAVVEKHWSTYVRRPLW